MAKENIDEYAMCDFCHTAKPSRELEKIRVVFRKCKECKVGSLESLKAGGSNLAGIVEKKKVVGGHPPADLREAFVPPEELMPKPGAKVEPKAEVKKEDVGANKSTTVQSPESGKSS